ncbi:MAG: hypothetical protein IIB85_00005 [Chloroflexi bacterium]|nr:hypothetical protein [Chloroflexota bacterium]
MAVFRSSAGTTKTKSPDSRWLRLSYLKLLPTRWAFKVRIDCAKNYRHKSARTLLDKLKAALAFGRRTNGREAVKRMELDEISRRIVAVYEEAIRERGRELAAPSDGSVGAGGDA